MGWSHMYPKRTWVVGWGKPNLVRNVEENMLEAVLKDGMIGWVENQTHEQDLVKRDDNLKRTLR
jgi:hypothetical protein